MEELKITYRDWNYTIYKLWSEEETCEVYEIEYKSHVSKRVPKDRKRCRATLWSNGHVLPMKETEAWLKWLGIKALLLMSTIGS